MKRRRSTTCTICKHPERHRIEMLRIGGASLDAVAEKFGVGRDAIHRHVANQQPAGNKLRLHDLRGTHETLLLDAGVPVHGHCRTVRNRA